MLFKDTFRLYFPFVVTRQQRQRSVSVASAAVSDGRPLAGRGYG